MLVGERMKSPVITVRPDMSLIDALNLDETGTYPPDAGGQGRQTGRHRV